MAIDESQQEGVDVDALDKTLEKLTKAFEKLNDSILDMAKNSSKTTTSNKVDHEKLHKNR